jgi:hypothetical protein
MNWSSPSLPNVVNRNEQQETVPSYNPRARLATGPFVAVTFDAD